MRDLSLNEALLKRIEEGDLDAATSLLGRGADVNAIAPLTLSDSGDRSTLSRRRVEMAAVDGIAPLLLAAWCGNSALCTLLLDRGADINIKDKYGRTPLLISAAAGHRELTGLFLDRGADLFLGRPGSTPLFRYVVFGYDDLVRALLDRGVDVNTRDDRRRTPLMWAAGLSDALYSGFQQQHVDTVRLLLESGADPSAQNKYGLSALMYAGRNVEVVRLLLAYGADVRSRDAAGRTALRWARLKGRKEAAELIEKAEALVE